MVVKMKKKTLKISEETHRKLKLLGNKGETFDDIIRRLLPPERPRPGEMKEERMEKIESLAKLARRKKKKALESGKLGRTETGWIVDLDAY